jgi:hypothetical protein
LREAAQRPYVPHRTPASVPKLAGGSDFVLSRPFVPGSREELPAIEQFLAPEPASDLFSNAVREEDRSYGFDQQPRSVDDELEELPPVEHFVDPLPPVAAFAPGDAGALFDEGSSEPVAAASETAVDETEWLEADLQQYDWRAAAALGDGLETEATNEWATTDWEVTAPVSRDKRPTAAEAIADALDNIAQRIRDGELAVPPPVALTDPAAIAATLAAILGVKR